MRQSVRYLVGEAVESTIIEDVGKQPSNRSCSYCIPHIPHVPIVPEGSLTIETSPTRPMTSVEFGLEEGLHAEKLVKRFCICGREIQQEKSEFRHGLRPGGDILGQYSNGRRSSIEVCVDILEAVSKGIEKPTNIMSASNTNWAKLKDALVVLLSNGLLTARSLMGRYTYRLTNEGYIVLREFMKVRGRLGVVGPRATGLEDRWRS